ncbi:alkaline phosphatase family protein, partial [Parvimonas micra]|uniref:alkaline phosphatase family protein n=1 Tax=Parvimonas micra TaxID=33033 RepID=UPI002B4791A4
CIDGCEPDYITQALLAGLMPQLQRILQTRSSLVADAVMPTFTNPNNLSIVTGAPPAVHGIAGNYFLDRETGREVMMNEP